jgi:hypothetical protein
MLAQVAPGWKAPSDTSIRVGAAACGLVGVVALGIYFGAAPPLPPLDAGAMKVADVGVRYHGILFLGAWLQATGTLLCVVFFTSLVQLAGGVRRLSGLLAVVGAGTLLAVSVIEGAFTIDWAQAAADGHPAVALSSYDVMTVFVHIFPVAPAPLVYLALGAVVLGSDVLPRLLGHLALLLGAAFAVVGLSGLYIAPLLTLVVVGAQSLWIVAAAIWLLARARRRDAAPGPPSGDH